MNDVTYVFLSVDDYEDMSEFRVEGTVVVMDSKTINVLKDGVLVEMRFTKEIGAVFDLAKNTFLYKTEEFTEFSKRSFFSTERDYVATVTRMLKYD